MDIKAISKKDYDALRNSRIFKDLDDKAMRDIICDESCFKVHFKKKDSIYSDKQYLNAFAYVNKGKAIIKSQSSVYLMRFLDEHSFFGVVGLFSNDDIYVSDIEAKSNMEVIFFKEDLIKRCIEKYPVFSYNLVSFLIDRISFLNKRINVISNSSNIDKLSCFIHIELERYGDHFSIEDSYAKLAERLNMSRASLYRAFDELEDRKIIKKEEKNIIVKDKDFFNKF